ncbi:MAG: hypothetical protein LRS49_02335 [Desulfurococcales archaeon]|nr:hypothetical protein [Desulfurococcales archaeon]
MALFREGRDEEAYRVRKILEELRIHSPEAYEVLAYLIGKISSLEDIVGELRELASDLKDSQERRISSLNQAVSRFDARIKNMENALAMLSESVERVENRVNELWSSQERRFDILDDTVSRLQARLAGIEATLAELGESVERVENKIGALAEASLSRLALQEFERRGYRILDYRRNVIIDDREVDYDSLRSEG